MEVLFNTLIQNKNNSRYKNTWLKEQAAVAIIFRGDIDVVREEKIKFRSIKNLEVLFIQRQFSPRDPYSGQIAFPGGKCELGENDYDAALRETLEEVGLDLIKWNAICVSTLNQNAFVRTTTRKKLLYCSAYVFLIHDPNKEISLRVNPSEVRDVRWVPIQYFIDPQLKLKSSTQQFNLKILKQWTNGCLLPAVNIGMDEVLLGLSFYFIVAVFIKMRDERFLKIIEYAKFFEFSFRGPLKVPLAIGYKYLFKYNRISIIEKNYYRYYVSLVIAIIIFLWIYL